ncbi:MAG: M48 family metallopeptidase [Magnetococcus sp. DMHC-6]
MRARILDFFERNAPSAEKSLVREPLVHMVSKSLRVLLTEGVLEYDLVRVRTRKRVALRVLEDGRLEVRVGLRTSMDQVERVLREQEAWIRRQYALGKERKESQIALGDGTLLPFLDETFILTLLSSADHQVRLCSGRLEVGGGVGDRVGLVAVLEQWYRAQARSHFQARLSYWGEQIGYQHQQLEIRGQKTRWGSCSSSGTISLNWHLLWAPSRVVDYVVVHELCHFVHRNHSPLFWALVARYIPDFRECRQWLKGHYRAAW